MPYANLPDDPETIAKMDRCVATVMKQGKTKPSAVAICYTSLTDEKAVVENDNPYLVLGELVTLEQFDIGEQVETKQGRGWSCPSCGHHQRKKPEEAICPECGAQMGRALVATTMTALSSQVKCLAPSCGSDAEWQMVVAGQKLHYCDEHREGAEEMLDRHGLELEDVKQLVEEGDADSEQPALPFLLNTKQNHTSAILALKPSTNVAQEVNIGSQDADDLHVTLVYLGDVDVLDKEQVVSAVRGLAKTTAPIQAKLNGITRFTETHEEGQHAIVLNVDAPELPETRQKLVETLRNLGVELMSEHGFTPHMTLAYIEESEETPEVALPSEPVTFDKLWLFWAGEQEGFEFGGEGEKQEELIAIKEEPVSTKAALQPFILFRRTWTHTPVKAYDLFIKEGGKKTWNFESPDDLLKGQARGVPKGRSGKIEVTDTDDDDHDIWTLKKGNKIQVKGGSMFNPTPSQRCRINVLDTGEATLSDKKAGFREYDFDGGKLKGDRVFELHDQEAGVWLMSKSGKDEETGEKQVTPDLDAIAATIANSEGVKVSADEIKKVLLEPWLATTAGTPEALVLQKTAARTFGHKTPMRMADEFEQVDVRWDMMVPIGTIYNNTQEYLKQKGLSEDDTIEVYHPYLPSEVGPRSWQKDDEVRIKLLPLTSWSTNMKDAMTFASFLGSPGKPAFLIRTFIPIKSVVSVPQTGMGLPGTDEVVLAGGEYEGIVAARLE